MGQGSRLNQRARNLLETIVVSGGYLALFLLLHHASAQLEFFSGIREWYLPAGLTMALLLAYGPTYSIAVLAANLLAVFWLQEPELPMTWGLGFGVATTGVYTLTSSLLRRVLWSGRVQLRSRRVAAQLLLGGSLTGIAAAMVGSLILMLSGNLPLQALPGATFETAVAHVTGILVSTPFLLLFVVPALTQFLRRIGQGHSGAELTSLIYEQGTLLRQGLRILAMDAAILWCVFAVPGEDLFLKFCLLLLPLIWVGLAAGIEGTAAAVFGLGTGFFVLLQISGLQLADQTGVQMLLSLAALNGMLVAAAVTERDLVEKSNNYRDAVLSAVSFAAEQLLSGDDWKQGFSEVLRRLGHAGEVSRVYLLEAIHSNDKVKFTATPYEWTAADMDAEAHQQNIMDLVRGHHLENHLDLLLEGEAYAYEASQLDGKERAIAEAMGLRSTVIVPIFVEENLWGCLGLDRNYDEPEWEQPEIDALLAVAHSLGTLMARAKIEEQFRQLVGNIRAVFWIASPDGHDRTYVSHAYEQLWGASRETLRHRPDSWLDVIHDEDLQRVEKSLATQIRGEYDLEYRIILPDRSVRWMHDRGSPVRNEAGEITQIVGIAEDITAQKEVEDRIHGTTHLLTALIDSLRSGVLVEDESRKVRWVNHAFCKMFNIPISKESLVGTDSRLLYAGSRPLAERIEEIIHRGVSYTGEELSHEDKIFHRDYVPLSVSKHGNYHLWQYQNVTDQKQAEEQIKASLKEKDVLLQEIHHRVKNNLQVISSLLSLQSNLIDDKQVLQIFEDSQNRVRAMALVHERLYQSEDLARIDFPGYAQVLTEHLIRSYGAHANIKLRMEVEPVPLDVDMAIPCGLIINELVSNSLKYAFPKGRKGEILIKFSDDHGQLRLVIRDDGVGFRKKVDLQTTQSLGLKLVHSLTKQLGGDLTYRNDQGTEFDIRFFQDGEDRMAQRITA